MYWRETNTRKPTLGEWFQKMVGDMQKEIDAQDDDFKGPKYVDPRTGKDYHEDQYGERQGCVVPTEQCPLAACRSCMPLEAAAVAEA